MPATPLVAFLLAGGEGRRLRPYTDALPKPALPFAGRCRVIDFALSNLVNSATADTFVLLQYEPRVLVEHLATQWSRLPQGRRVHAVLPVVPWLGTADAVHRNLALLDGLDPAAVAVLAADHVCRMDLRQMFAFHRAHRADATVAALPVPIAEASRFGVIDAGADHRIRAFAEKPAVPRASPHDAGTALASMGNYLFAPDVLRRALDDAARRGGTDFGRDVLPQLVQDARVFAYDFRANRIPGAGPAEEAGYWRDIGTIPAYEAAQQDTVGRFPRLQLDNPRWPIGGRPGAAAVRPPGPFVPADRPAVTAG